MNNYLRFNVSVLAVAVSLAAGYAHADKEGEANHPVVNANFVNVTTHSGELAVEAAIGTADPAAAKQNDQDFFQFAAKAGDVIQIDVDNGYGMGQRSVDTTITLFGPKEDGYPFLAECLGAKSVDEGSKELNDPLLEGFRIEKDGVYTVAVTAYPQRFYNNIDTLLSSRYIQYNGDYTLKVSGLKPPIKHINIDVRPNSSRTDATDWLPLNVKSKGKIPVALLSSGDFDPATVDTTSLKFGQTGDERSLSHCNHGQHDFNKDGVMDLVCHFNIAQGAFNEDEPMGIIKGQMTDGAEFTGTGMLKAKR